MLTIDEIIAKRALVVLNDSGGKDSQAMRIRLLKLLPKDQVLIVHATLGEVEWPGALEHAENGAKNAGVPFVVAKAKKTLLEMVRNRHATRPGVPSWPSAKYRQCTSDLKRSPIRSVVGAYAKKHGFTTIVNCMGMRAEESSKRAKLPVWKLNKKLCSKNREWFDWLPIHDLKKEEVFAAIKEAGESPHYAYARGNERLSCVFCIMGSANDLRNGALRNPELYRTYVELERSTGYTMHQSKKSLPVITGIAA